MSEAKAVTDQRPTNNEVNWTGPTGIGFKDIREPSGVCYRSTTPRQVVEGLEQARENGSRVRLFYGDSKTGRSWHEENDCVGRVGSSTGPHKVPVLLARGGSMGGGAILTDCIIRLLVGGQEVYRHPKYRVPTVTLEFSSKYNGNQWLAKIDGKAHARFKTELAAARWAAFMRGERRGK